MKKILVVLVLIFSVVFMPSCMNPQNPSTDVENTKESPITNSHMDYESLIVDSFENATVDDFIMSYISEPEVAVSPASDPYKRYSLATAITNPWYINENAEKEKKIDVSGKNYQLKYERTIISDTIIADEYVSDVDTNIKFRYYRNTDVLAEVVGIESVQYSGNEHEYILKFTSINSLVNIDADYTTEQGLIEYSEKVAKAFGVVIDGLKPVAFNGFSRERNIIDYTYAMNGLDSDAINNGKVIQRGISWCKEYSNGITIPVFRVSYDVDNPENKLVRVQITPQVPDKAFSFTKDEIIATFKNSTSINITDMQYEVVCNNILTLNVVCTQTASDGYVSTFKVKMFPKGVVRPELPEEVGIPSFSGYPYGIGWYRNEFDGYIYSSYTPAKTQKEIIDKFFPNLEFKYD